MKSICIIEDCEKDAEQHEKYIKRFLDRKNEMMNIRVYNNGVDF